MSLYVDKSYVPVVNNFFTGAGYDVETREQGLVFFRAGVDDQVISQIVLQVSEPDSFDSVDKPRALPIDLADVITFDGAYSLFPARYDDEISGEPATPVAKDPPFPLPAKPKAIYRSFSDRSSWVVTFEQQQALVVPPQLAFGTSLPPRDPLYTSTLQVSPPNGRLIKRHRDIQLCGVVLRSRLLRLTHILCCAELSQFVQQFLTRLVIAHPGRSNSQCVPNLDLSRFPTFTCISPLTEACASATLFT
ncbi:hypothetical protein BJV77DRAFT_739934 [Russula vinacea]|nr:hypothetical protein BJV77DRAFT_739934 [Russula vinacea]